MWVFQLQSSFSSFSLDFRCFAEFIKLALLLPQIRSLKNLVMSVRPHPLYKQMNGHLNLSYLRFCEHELFLLPLSLAPTEHIIYLSLQHGLQVSVYFAQVSSVMRVWRFEVC